MNKELLNFVHTDAGWELYFLQLQKYEIITKIHYSVLYKRSRLAAKDQLRHPTRNLWLSFF